MAKEKYTIGGIPFVECACCYAFTPEDEEKQTMCVQCKVAGCDRKKAGEKCHLQTMQAAPIVQALPVTQQ
jgi:hypothetical protein